MKKKYKVENIDCANCAAKLETAIQKIAGVEEATLSFMTQKLTIEAKEEDFDQIMSEVVAIAQKMEPDWVVNC
jgi:copper chaperone CopZ